MPPKALLSTIHKEVSWQQALSDVITDYSELLEMLQLDHQQAPHALMAENEFPLRVPRPFAERMEPGNWQDPLLQQVLPLGKELDYQPGFQQDPLQEKASNPLPGLIHKYQSRVLMVVSGGCAIHCRYCFRRHFPYADNNPGRQQWQAALDYIRGNIEINEVIYSGGDPLVASDKLLADLTREIATIEHVKTLRIHSRLPVVIPQRINDQCLNWLTATRLRPVLVIHSNHANEIDEAVGFRLKMLANQGVTVLNQTVLLAGINDEPEILAKLSERLLDFQTLPYYLHLLDRVQGAAHFDVSEQKAVAITRQLLTLLPGYLVPRLVKEVPEAKSKLPIAVF